MSSTTDSNFEYSKTFRDITAEIVYQSCDNVRFRIHAIYLKAHTGILAPPEGASLEEVVHLPESAATLELLFKFIYPVIQPVLALEAGFRILKDLAEASEKYQVFPAMYACHLQMQATLPNHAIFVLGYALRHGYPDLVDKAAPYATDSTCSDVIHSLPSEFLESWWKYHEMWKNVRKRAICSHLNSFSGSNVVTICSSGSALSMFRDHVQHFPDRRHEPDWFSAIKRDVDAIPKMTDIAGFQPSERGEDFNEARTTLFTVGIESCDGVQYCIDPEVLRACTKGLLHLHRDKIQVPETSSTMGLLLQYLSPTRSPNLGALSFEELRDLAIAAEKYSVHPAMGSCRVMMKRSLPNHTKEILQYAFSARYLDVLDLAARFNVGQHSSFSESVQDLPPMLLIPWARYYQSWLNITNTAILKVSRSPEASIIYRGYRDACECQPNDPQFSKVHLLPIVGALLDSPQIMASPDLLFPASVTCRHARYLFDSCRKIFDQLIEGILPLSSLM